MLIKGSCLHGSMLTIENRRRPETMDRIVRPMIGRSAHRRRRVNNNFNEAAKNLEVFNCRRRGEKIPVSVARREFTRHSCGRFKATTLAYSERAPPR
ncbi:MAG: hypothetical protein ABR587_00320 [Candidatus Binatia bacterium]